MLKILGVKSHVFSMDIDLSLLDPVAKECPDVTFIEGNSSEIEKYFPPELLQVRKHIANYHPSTWEYPVIFLRWDSLIFRYISYVQYDQVFVMNSIHD